MAAGVLITVPFGLCVVEVVTHGPLIAFDNQGVEPSIASTSATTISVVESPDRVGARSTNSLVRRWSKTALRPIWYRRQKGASSWPGDLPGRDQHLRDPDSIQGRSQRSDATALSRSRRRPRRSATASPSSAHLSTRHIVATERSSSSPGQRLAPWIGSARARCEQRSWYHSDRHVQGRVHHCPLPNPSASSPASRLGAVVVLLGAALLTPWKIDHPHHRVEAVSGRAAGSGSRSLIATESTRSACPPHSCRISDPTAPSDEAREILNASAPGRRQRSRRSDAATAPWMRAKRR